MIHTLSAKQTEVLNELLEYYFLPEEYMRYELAIYVSQHTDKDLGWLCALLEMRQTIKSLLAENNTLKALKEE